MLAMHLQDLCVPAWLSWVLLCRVGHQRTSTTSELLGFYKSQRHFEKGDCWIRSSACRCNAWVTAFGAHFGATWALRPLPAQWYNAWVTAFCAHFRCDLGTKASSGQQCNAWVTAFCAHFRSDWGTQASSAQWYNAWVTALCAHFGATWALRPLRLNGFHFRTPLVPPLWAQLLAYHLYTVAMGGRWIRSPASNGTVHGSQPLAHDFFATWALMLHSGTPLGSQLLARHFGATWALILYCGTTLG